MIIKKINTVYQSKDDLIYSSSPGVLYTRRLLQTKDCLGEKSAACMSEQREQGSYPLR